MVPDPNLHVLMPDNLSFTCFVTDPVFQWTDSKDVGKLMLNLVIFSKMAKNSIVGPPTSRNWDLRIHPRPCVRPENSQ